MLSRLQIRGVWYDANQHVSNRESFTSRSLLFPTYSRNSVTESDLIQQKTGKGLGNAFIS